MASLWRAYSRILDKFPWGANILQTGIYNKASFSASMIYCYQSAFLLKCIRPARFLAHQN